jgi:diphthamide synthase (EF-2-diphthine--ammonia ligase)
VNETYLDKSFAGRIIDEDFIKDLPENVDVCGENGEFLYFYL